jgi:hypothetical protein
VNPKGMATCRQNFREQLSPLAGTENRPAPRSGLSVSLDGTAAGTNKGWGGSENGPAAVLASLDFLAKHATYHRSAPGCPTGPGANARTLADLLEGPGSPVNGFDHNPFSNFVAKANRPVGVDNCRLSSFSFLIVDCSTPGMTRALELQILNNQTRGC